MNRFGYIENKTETPIEFVPLTLGSLEKSILTGQCDNSYSYFKISEQFYEGNINVYDINNNLLDEESFQKTWRFYHENIIQYSGNTYKIYEFLSDDTLIRLGKNFKITPKSVDYKKDVNSRLHPKCTFLRGFLVKCEYFEKAKTIINPYNGFEELSYENSVLNVKFNYYIGDDGYVSHRDAIRSWSFDNGEYSDDVKVSKKFYQKKQAKEEGKRRRVNVVDQVIIDTGGLIMLTESGVTTVREAEELALPFLDEFNTDIDKYIKGNTEPIINNLINVDTVKYYWITNTVPMSDPSVTIQEYIIYNLNGGTIENVGLVN